MQELVNAPRPGIALADSNLTVKLVIVQWAVTFAHHVYGGISFDSPGRIIAALAFSVILAVTLWFHHVGRSRRWGRAAFATLVIGFWLLLLGLYEGGYNHVLYLVLRAIDRETATRLYPAGSDAVISGDVFFQGTGALTLVVGVLAAVSLLSARRAAGVGGESRA